MASLKSAAGSYYVISSNRWLLVHMREAYSVGLASYPGPCAERSVCGPGYEASVGLASYPGPRAERSVCGPGYEASVGLASYPGPRAERSVCGSGYEASVGLASYPGPRAERSVCGSGYEACVQFKFTCATSFNVRHFCESECACTTTTRMPSYTHTLFP